MHQAKQSSWVVLKFGGTSVSTKQTWETIAQIIQDRLQKNLRPVVVCSALSGISDKLENLVKQAVNNNHQEIFQEIGKIHAKFANELGVAIAEIQPDIEKLNALAITISLAKENTPHLHAQVLSLGEIMLTKLGAAFLHQNDLATTWYDARKYLQAKPMPDASLARNILSAHCETKFDENLHQIFTKEPLPIIITQGFIAKNEQNECVLLGRGGSDVSAAYFAAKLNAKHCEIWTDVPGLYTANPHQVSNARLLKKLDYEEAQEIASSGAKVLHPRCIAPLRQNNIPLEICCTLEPTIKGTQINNDPQTAGAQLKAIAAKHGITLISLETMEMWHQVGFLAKVFDCFRRHGISIDLISTSESNVSVTLDQATNTMDDRALNSLLHDLNSFCQAKAIDSCAVVSLVGRNIRGILHQLAPALKLFEEHKIYLVSQAANDLNLSFVVDQDHAARLVGKLHEELLGPNNNSDPNLGLTWEETFSKSRPKPATVDSSAWWYKRRDELLGFAAKCTPLYVYNKPTIEQKISELKTISAANQIFYSVKANPLPYILKVCYEADLGFECVSPSEINLVLSLFKNIDPKRILFTPNFAPRLEYEHAINKGVNITLDNLFPLENWPELFKGKEIFLRIDPGQGQGHHKYVRTAGFKSKFGIAYPEFEKLSKLLKKNKTRVIGLHAHVGSNIFTPETWSNTALYLIEVSKHFPEAKILDLGGGLGVVEKPGQAPLNLEKVNDNLAKVKTTHPNFEFWLEPGRFIVASAGVLLAEVTQTKQKGEHYYVGINTGMNSLIRPALYGSYHEIVNLTKIDDQDFVSANIVGPICESGDVLGSSRKIADPKTGDILLIGTVGAYGRVMSSSYNLRRPAQEHFLD
ncbi:MAG: bifunctional aspartate kinase/diaminopimelate decarboxylase [Pseudomonadota bacterium]